MRLNRCNCVQCTRVQLEPMPRPSLRAFAYPALLALAAWGAVLAWVMR